MNPAIFLTLALIAQVHSACICSFGEGTDMCHGGSKCAPMVVRPAKLPKLKIEDITKPRVVCKQVGGIPGLKPVGDLCSCKQSIVVPAFVPRPSCASCSSCSGQKSNSASSSSASSSFFNSGSSSHASSSGSSSSHSGPVYDYEPQEEVLYTAAADPVSLSLAYKMQHKTCGAHEDRLAFGFRKLPVDGSKAKIVKNVPEELLFNLNGEIVELKPVSCKGSSLSIDEEAMEDLAAEEFAEQLEESQGSGSVKKLSYGDIGFGPAKVAAVPFVSVQGGGAGVISSQSSSSSSSDSSDCNDGFVPAPAAPEDCDSDEDIAVPIRYMSSYSSSSSSSSSSSNSANHHVQYSCGN